MQNSHVFLQNIKKLWKESPACSQWTVCLLAPREFPIILSISSLNAGVKHFLDLSALEHAHTQVQEVNP